MKEEADKRYKFLVLFLILAITAVILFLIIPQYWPAAPDKEVEAIDFSNSAWLEAYVEENAGLFGKDFFLNSAFSYNPRSHKMIVTYASKKSVEEARAHYLTLPGAEESGENDETSLNISAEEDGRQVRIYNYFSPVSRVFELALTADTAEAERIISGLQEAFPAAEVAAISELTDLVAGDVFGGYVRYHYDNLDDFAHPHIPIYSQAYLYDGGQDAYQRTIERLNEAYPDNKYDETQNTHYYKINGHIVSVSFLVTDAQETIVSISVQKEPAEEAS